MDNGDPFSEYSDDKRYNIYSHVYSTLPYAI